MARFLKWIGCVTLYLALAMPGALAKPLEEEPPMALSSSSAVLMEAETGAVLFEKSAQEARTAASLTKLMTLLLIFEKIDEGEMALTDQVTASPNAARQTGSRALIDAHASYPPGELLKATIIASGNDSAVALAEYAAGTEENFVKQVNEKARQLGLVSTCY